MGRTSFLGREAVLQKLLRLRDAGLLGQPFLFAGPEGSGKENTALEFARLLNCAAPDTCTPERRCESCVKTLGFQHPDIRWIGPAPAAVKEDEVRALLEAKMEHPFHRSPWAATSFVAIGDPEHPGPLSIRSVIQFLRRRAFQSPYKVAIVADGHRMNPAAANAFLKTLEEPPPRSLIFLLSSGADRMLPTILSRCQKISFDPWPADELATLLGELTTADPAALAEAARASDGNARRALALLEPDSRVLVDWARQLFDWIHRGDRAQAAIAADELHRGVVSHSLDVDPALAKDLAKMGKEGPVRRERAIRLCELLNLHYSDAVTRRESGDACTPRLSGSVPVTKAAASRRETAGLLADMYRIEETRREIDRNINVGLAMAELCEGLIDHVESDATAGGRQTRPGT